MDWERVMQNNNNLQTGLLSQTKKFSKPHYMTYCIPLERFFNADSKTYGRFFLKMDWERVIRHFSNLQTRLLLAQQKKLIGHQYMSCYIPLESIFSTDSKNTLQHISENGLGTSFQSRK